ncbi:MAG: NYN domain-containing protein [Anaerolineae bacterium]|nr:NYN domain-containing protein [Thermoflexales bacterium]MDW8406952.1 NYN domain-containing protein [Anaerolineae bacterium]
MPFLIDGHNLIGQMPNLSLSDPDDENKLIARLKEFCERANKRVIVVFDPSPHQIAPAIGHGRVHLGRLTAHYAPAGSKADDIIRLLVSEITDKQGWIVVTSDSSVANFTRMSGVRVESCAKFIQRMRNASATPAPTDKPQAGQHEVENWAAVFKEPPPSANDKRATPPLKRKPPKKKRSQVLAEQLRNVRPLF